MTVKQIYTFVKYVLWSNVILVCTVNVKDANGGTVNVANLRVAFSNMNGRPLSVTEERSRLYGSINVAAEPNATAVKIGNMPGIELRLKCLIVFLILPHRRTGTNDTRGHALVYQVENDVFSNSKRLGP